MAMGTKPSTSLLEREYEKTAEALAETGVAIEINTSGLRKGGPEPFPAGGLLRRCMAAGVPVTYGSDSHRPSEVGHAREVVATLVRPAALWRPRGGCLAGRSRFIAAGERRCANVGGNAPS
jgi:hypothetical protein